MNPGYLYAAAAFLLWGVLPTYWKQLDAIPTSQLVAHRVVWSIAILMPLVALTGAGGSICTAFMNPGLLARQGLAAIFVSANWLGFVWAVTHGRMIESSLGYFLNPLLSVLVGVVVLGERLRPMQWIAIVIAALGVTWLAAQYHHFPWIALFLAGTFCLYSLAKKQTSLGAVPSLTVETLLLVVPASLFLIGEHVAGRGSFGRFGWRDDLLIAFSGVVTVVPLLCFAAAARRIPLSAIGLMQYLGPSLQFLLGVFVYAEPFDAADLMGFAIVWTALLLYVIDDLRRLTLARPVDIAADSVH
ncbi:MAG: EamA family transporter RarD [Planctomycetaceae bacterium]